MGKVLSFSNYKNSKSYKFTKNYSLTSTFLFLITLAALILISSCSGGKAVAKIYSFENGETQKLYKSVSEKDEEFLLDLINLNYPVGHATGEEEPNFVIIYNEGTDSEYQYKLIVDLETDVLTYITADDGITAPRVLNSYTTALEFFDFLSK